jgi:hypothetical protein
MKKKRVLILHHSNKIGGAEKSLQDFLQELLRRQRIKYHIILALPAGGGLSHQIKNLGVEVINIPFKRIRRSFNPFVLLIYILKNMWITTKLNKYIIKKKSIWFMQTHQRLACSV